MPLPRSSALVLSGALAVVLSGCSSDEAGDDAGPGAGTSGAGTSGGGAAGVSGSYITDPGEGSVWYDDMVVARRRIGCLR